MRRVIREVITLIRIERWLVAGEDTGAPHSGDGDGGEQVVEQIVLSGAEAAQARELFRRIVAGRRWEIARADSDNQHEQGSAHDR